MVGTKRSTRLAARKSRPKYDEAEMEEYDDNSSRKIESEDDGESDFTGEGSDDGLPLRPAETRAITRRGGLDRQSRKPADTSKPSAKQPLKSKSKRKPKAWTSSFEQKYSPFMDDDGSDHAEDDGYGQRRAPPPKSSKRTRSTSDASMDGKRRKMSLDNGNKSPPKNEEMKMAEAGGAPMNPEVGPASCDADSLPISKIDIGGGKKKEPNLLKKYRKEKAKPNDPGPRMTSGETGGSTPKIDSNPPRNIMESPSSTSTSDEIERGERRKDSAGSDTTKGKYTTPSESFMPRKQDSKVEREGITAVNESEGLSKNNDRGGKDQVSADSSMQIDCQGKNERHVVKASQTGADASGDRCKRILGTPSLKKSPSMSSSLLGEKNKSLSSGMEKLKRGDAKELDRKKSSHLKPPSAGFEHKNVHKDGGGSGVMNFATSQENSGNVMVKKVDARKGYRRLKGTSSHRPGKQAPKGMDAPSPSEEQVGVSHSSNQPKMAGPILMAIRYPEPMRMRRAPSVDQLKMALFLEASNVHRGSGAERIFADYWEALERYIAVGSNGAIRRMRSDVSASLAGIEATLDGFLKTRKMKRLHNKLVLSIMKEAMRTNIPACCSSQVPRRWRTAAIKSIPSQLTKENDSIDFDFHERKSDLLQWNACFGPRSGAWSACEDDLALPQTDSGYSIRPELISCVQKDGLEEDEVLPSARLPGLLEIEPLVRKRTTNLGLTASDNAIWMLVVAVREHSASLIKKIIANDQDFKEGYTPSLPIHFQTSLACHRLTRSKMDDNVKSAMTGIIGRKHGKKVINSTSLSHMLAESPSVASRLTSMRSSVMTDDRGKSTSIPGLDNVNCIVNASIQRGAAKGQKSSAERQNVLSSATLSHLTLAPPAHVNSGHRKKPDGNLARGQAASTQTLSTPSLPLNKPHLSAQRRNQSIPLSSPPPPPQPQLTLPPMPPQNTQPLHSAQMMSHSVHTKESKPFEQQTLLTSRTDISNLEPLTKPGFPGFTNVSQKPEASQKPVPTTSPPPLKSIRRGSKNLAAMMARPLSQPKNASDKGSLASDEKNANGATMAKANIARQTEKQKEGVEDKDDDTKDSKLPATGPRPRGRGFGVKNLAKMRARASFSDSGK